MRWTGRWSPPGKSAPPPPNTYDAANRLTQVADSVSGTITRQYDIRFDTLTQEVTPLAAVTATVNYQYDTVGRRSQMQVVGQTAVTYGYDNADRLTGVTQGGNALGFTYDAAGRRTLATLPNLVTIDYGYDDANELTSLTYKRSGATLQNLTYGYDLAGRRITVGGTAARINLPPALASATYDANNRLANWAGVAQSYDFNGNLTNDGVNTYTWDVRDRLTGVAGSIPITNVYDPFNRRVSKTQSGVQNGWIYDGFSEVHTTSGAVVTNTLLNGLGLDERYARTSTGTTILTDAQGSTLSLVASNGAITGNFTYEPYGMSTQSGADTTSFRYTGRVEDTPNLLYYRARFYNPRTSRFISEDPIGLAGGYNLYAYVEGDPVGETDPMGLQGGTNATGAASANVNVPTTRDGKTIQIVLLPRPPVRETPSPPTVVGSVGPFAKNAVTAVGRAVVNGTVGVCRAVTGWVYELNPPPPPIPCNPCAWDPRAGLQ